MRLLVLATAGLVAGTALTACAPPAELAAPAPEAGLSEVDNPTRDPRLHVLLGEVESLRETLVAARDALAEAQRAGGLATARAAAEQAVHGLTAAPRLSGDLDGDGQAADPRVVPLFPGPADAIAPDASYGDVFSRVLTAARDAGGHGAEVIDLLRDPVGGSLGWWQNDAAGVLDLVVDVARSDELAEAEERVSEELEGEATRALAWALMAAWSRDLDVARGAAERGIVHLDLALAGVETVSGTAS